MEQGTSRRKGGREGEGSCTSRRRIAHSQLRRAWPAISTRPAPVCRRPSTSAAHPALAAAGRHLLPLLVVLPPRTRTRSAPSAPGMRMRMRSLPRTRSRRRAPGCPTGRAASPWAGASHCQCQQLLQHQRHQQQHEQLLLLSLFNSIYS